MVRIALLSLVLTLAALRARAEEAIVHQKDKQFSEASATLRPGDRIKFLNDDVVAHNILATGPGDETQNSGVQEPGEDTVVAFDKPGTYTIECGIHPHMHMTVTVK
jgi:plastocyanin